MQDGAGAPYGQAEPRRLTRLLKALEAAARGQALRAPPPPAPFSPRRPAFDVRPTTIIDLEQSPSAAVVEVSGADRPGRLADLARGGQQERGLRARRGRLDLPRTANFLGIP